MVTGTRFYPKGFIGSEAAILLIAKTRDPSRWAIDRILPDELAVWFGLGKTLNAEFVSNHLGILDKGQPNAARDASMMDRLCDFSDALSELRKALFSGEIVAHFLDESGKQHFILKDGWGGEEGEDILLRGVVDLVDGWRRLILLKDDDITNLARGLPPAWVYEDDKPANLAKDRALKRPAVEKRRLFEEWRASLENRIPTLSEDIQAMKAKGMNRDDVRELRRAHPRLPRGKPRALAIQAVR